jgi:hypothetical protein
MAKVVTNMLAGGQGKHLYSCTFSSEFKNAVRSSTSFHLE